jgi:hypothetical protein
MFTSAINKGGKNLRSKCLFIDQTYHGGRKYLFDSLYANFSLFHQIIWSFRSMMIGMKTEKKESTGEVDG